MKKNLKGLFALGGGLIAAFIVWTLLVSVIDVRAVGPEGSSVGLASFNSAVASAVGVHMALYELTDLLSIIPLGFIAGFGLLGLYQLVRRKSLMKVDCDILVLGVFYVVVLAVFVLFEVVEINYRPVLIEGVLEASYPSSTTMLSVCVLVTAMMQLRVRVGNRLISAVSVWFTGILAVVLVVGRIISGVHWASDIIGGLLFSCGAVVLYYAAVCAVGEYLSNKRSVKAK